MDGRLKEDREGDRKWEKRESEKGDKIRKKNSSDEKQLFQIQIEIRLFITIKHS